MGLDMNAYKVNPNRLVNPDAQVDLEFKPVLEGEDNGSVEINYWRKFHQLHGWMNRLYNSKGGESERFNCDTVRLMPADLLQLAIDADQGLESTDGFFFGSGDWSEESKDDVLLFCKDAKAAIDEGYAVYYSSWW